MQQGNNKTFKGLLHKFGNTGLGNLELDKWIDSKSDQLR
jgi:hypothetical protein